MEPDDFDCALDCLNSDVTHYTFGPVVAYRSSAGYGWEINVGRRLQFATRRASPNGFLPRLLRGADENCNRAITAVLQPLGSVTVWWEPRWRTQMCEECVAEMEAS